MTTQLYGRLTYKLMTVWETDPEFAGASGHDADFAKWWQRTEKVVCSTTLTDVVTERTQLERARSSQGSPHRRWGATGGPHRSRGRYWSATPGCWWTRTCAAGWRTAPPFSI